MTQRKDLAKKNKQRGSREIFQPEKGKKPKKGNREGQRKKESFYPPPIDHLLEKR